MKHFSLSEDNNSKEINQATDTLRNRSNVKISALNIILILIKILYSDYTHIHLYTYGNVCECLSVNFMFLSKQKSTNPFHFGESGETAAATTTEHKKYANKQLFHLNIVGS